MKKSKTVYCLLNTSLAMLALLGMSVSTARADYKSVVIGDHPLAYYPLDLSVDTNVNNGGQSLATDFSGNGNDGTYINIYPGYNNVTGPSVYITNGVSFDGATTFVDLSTGTNTSILNFGGLITIEAWVQAATSTAGGYVIGKGYDANQNGDEVEMRLNGGDIHSGTYNFTTSDKGVTGGNETANWTYLVSTYDGTNWNLYQNGVWLTSSPDTVGAINFSDPWAIGDGTESGNNRIIDGNLSQVALYDYALTQGQVTAHYFAGIYGTTNPLPNITQQPVSQMSFTGGNAAFSVSASSSSPLTYLWLKNGIPIAQTNATLVLINVQSGDSGNYSVQVINSAGSVTSVTVTLNVGIYSYTPVALAASSYNEDLIVEKGALNAATTATMDTGTNNSVTTWFEQGYDTANTAVGLPAAGSTFTSAAQSDHSYTMASNYTTNDAVLINSQVTHATLTLPAPTGYSALSLMASSGNGSTTINVIVHHADNTAETNSVTLFDWFNAGTVVLGTGGRLDAGSRSFSNISSPGNPPYLDSYDAPLVDTASPVTSMDVNWVSGTGNACLLAVSGSTGGAFSPIAVTGYNEDMIVEAGAQQFVAGSYTTASMDNGLQNTGNSWYEQGYSTTLWTAPGTGLPPAGSTFTNQAAANHAFTMASSYTAVNDVAYVDSATTATITPATPQAFYALSFLTGAGHGPVNVNYTVNHADGTSESGTFLAPDWFAEQSPAWIVNGRVDVGTAALQTWNGGNVITIYSEDVALTNTASPVNSINLSTTSGGVATVFAVSGVSILGTNTSASGPGNIIWQTPQVISGAADVSTQGIYFASWAPYDGGANTLPVNGVTFQGYSDLPGFSIEPPANNNFSGFGSPFTTDTNYNTLLQYGQYGGNGASATISWNGMTTGHTYEVQIWVEDARTNVAAARWESFSGGALGSAAYGTDTSLPVGYSSPLYSPPTGNPGYYITGTFVADSVGSEEILMTPWDASGNNSSSQINLMQVRDLTSATQSQPSLTSIKLSGTSLVINGTNGTAGLQFTVLVSTNLALPLNQWTPMMTNTFIGDSFSLTNAMSPGAQKSFYILRVP